MKQKKAPLAVSETGLSVLVKVVVVHNLTSEANTGANNEANTGICNIRAFAQHCKPLLLRGCNDGEQVR
jgi:hypothetical protein